MNARRFLWRWNRRVIRSEWRQYALIFALIAVATTLSTTAMLFVHNIIEPPEGQGFGRGNLIAESTNPDLLEQAMIDQGHTYGAISYVFGGVIVPGITNPVPMKAAETDNEVIEPLFSLVDGSWPVTADEIAVTDRALAGLARLDQAPDQVLGEVIEVNGQAVEVVGLFENPTDLSDEFILAADLDGLGFPSSDQIVQFLVTGSPMDVAFPPGVDINSNSRENFLAERTAITLVVSMISAIALLEVALVSSAGFAVIARRRSRQYGLLAAAGATPRQIRASGGIIGTILGLAASLVGVTLGTGFGALAISAVRDNVNHRINFAVPWWAVVPTLAFAVLVATMAARWPARAMSKQPVVTMLASMRVRPEPAGRTVVAGMALTAIGAVAMMIGVPRVNIWITLVGVIIGPIGLLLMAPLLVQQIGRLARRLPLPARMGGRAAARYSRRSGAMVAALGLALGIPAAMSTTLASLDAHQAAKPPNQHPNVGVLWLPGAKGSRIELPAVYVDNAVDPDVEKLVAEVAAAAPGIKLAPVDYVVSPVAKRNRANFERLGAAEAYQSVRGLVRGTEADCGDICDTTGFGEFADDGEEIIYLNHVAWLATPPLLDVLGLEAAFPDPSTIAVGNLDGMRLYAGWDVENATDLVFDDGIDVTTIKDVPLLRAENSARMLISPEWVDAQPGYRTATMGWVMVSPEPIPAEVRDTINDIAGDTLVPEFHQKFETTPVANRALLAGLLAGLGIAVAAVTLLNGERARDNQILRSIGAPAATTRSTAAAIAGFLAVAGALIAVAIGFLALVPQLVNPLGDFPFVIPWMAMGTLLILFPLLAAAIGWLSSPTKHQNLARPR